ncbi:hypothetical protein Hanom_Chr08g00684591 [Helianthus anomalus]
MNLDEFDTALTGFVDLPIYNLNRFFHKMERVINMNLGCGNDNSILRWTFL